MISYNPRKCDYDATKYGKGYKVLKTTDLHKISVMINRYVWSPIIWKTDIRSSENFLRAEWIGLDFDEGMSLVEAQDTFCDRVMILGTTRRHGKVKNGIIADRFRIAFKTELPITRLSDYRATVQKYIKNHGADRACSDGARFFWPCTNIVTVRPEGLLEEVESGAEDQGTDQKFSYDPHFVNEEKKKFAKCGLPFWMKEFLTKGTIPSFYGSRNTTCNQIARRLLCLEFTPDKILQMLKNAPFPREGFSDREITTAVDSAIKYVQRQIEKGGIITEKEKINQARDWLRQRSGDAKT